MRRASLLALSALALAATSVRAACAQTAPSALSPAERARADSGRPPFTSADVHFMSGMIHHHAQAVLIAGWAQSHGADRAVQALCERIVVGQRDEIGFMQRWLRDRRQPVPEADASHDMMAGMEGMHEMMPGMLTPEQLVALDKARGVAWERLFLQDMIQHHQGALQMVDQLFSSPGAGQDDQMFKFASDVSADQTTEIDRMQAMLDALDRH